MLLVVGGKHDASTDDDDDDDDASLLFVNIVLDNTTSSRQIDINISTITISIRSDNIFKISWLTMQSKWRLHKTHIFVSF